MTKDKITTMLNISQQDYDQYLELYEANPTEESVDDMEARIYLEGYISALEFVLELLEEED